MSHHPARHEFSVADTEPAAATALIKASVVPRPIAWVSTRSADGVDNLAPHSFFTVVSNVPPMIAFTSSGRKDTLANIEATGEFVVCVTPAALFEQVNTTGTNFPAHISEFDAAGLQREPSASVAPPRVAEAPVAIECAEHQLVPVGDSFLVIGEVKHIAVADSVTEELPDGTVLPRVEAMAPLSRLGMDEWGLLGEIRRITTVPYSG